MSYEIRGLRPGELQEHAELVYRSYREYVKDESDGLADPRWWLHVVENDPYYSPEQTRVMVIDGRLVSTVTNYLRWMHCAGRQAKVSAIGSVATDPDYRGRGYVRQVLAESRRWMEAERFNFCFLFGNEQVYGSSGWRMFSAFETIASVRTPQKELGLTVRLAQFPEDVPTLCAIYDEFCAGLVGPFVRSSQYWERRVTVGYFADRSREYFIVEREGEPVAYFRSTEPGHVNEVGWLRQAPELPWRVVGTVLRQWPDREETHFGFWHRELRQALDPFIWAPTQAAGGQRMSVLRLEERYKGLWTYIGPGRGEFPEVTDTESLLQFLRRNEYVFWSGADSF